MVSDLPIGEPTTSMRGWLRQADTWAGLSAIALGGALLIIGADYGLGRAGRIGPGLAPRLLAIILCGLGALLMVRAHWSREPFDADIAWRPLLLVTTSIVAFALVLDRAGLLVAILAAVLVAGPAAAGNTVLSVTVSGAALAAFSWALFVKALKLSIPLLWF